MSTVTYVSTRTFWITIVALALAVGVLFVATGSSDDNGRKDAIGATRPAPSRALCEQFNNGTPRIRDSLQNNHPEYDFNLCQATPTPTPTQAPTTTKTAPTSAQCATYNNTTSKGQQDLMRSYSNVDWTKCPKAPATTPASPTSAPCAGPVARDGTCPVADNPTSTTKVVNGITYIVGPSTATSSVAKCPAGTRLTGGGANLLGRSGADALAASYPSAFGTAGSWTAVRASGSASAKVQAYAICTP